MSVIVIVCGCVIFNTMKFICNFFSIAIRFVCNCGLIVFLNCGLLVIIIITTSVCGLVVVIVDNCLWFTCNCCNYSNKRTIPFYVILIFSWNSKRGLDVIGINALFYFALAVVNIMYCVYCVFYKHSLSVLYLDFGMFVVPSFL